VGVRVRARVQVQVHVHVQVHGVRACVNALTNRKGRDMISSKM